MVRSARSGLLRTALLGALLLGAVGPLAGTAAPAAAAPTGAPAIVPAETVSPEPPSAPDESPAPTPFATAAAPAPTLDSPAADSFVTGAVNLSGTRDPDHEIQVLSPVGAEPLCIVATDGTAAWQCTGVLLPSGPAVSLRVVVTGDAGLSAAHTVRVLQAPTVTGGPTEQVASNGMVRGTGYPGATVTATLATGASCAFTADASGAWACQLQGAVATGDEQITASQQTPFSTPDSSAASDPVTLSFDVDAPASPSVAGPTGTTRASGSGPYFGQGENGATVTVFAGAYSVCSAVVSGGTWSCTGSGVKNGTYELRAVQQDAAGNVSAGSAAIRVTFGVAPATPTPTPTPTTAPPVAAAASTAPTPTAPPAPASDAGGADAAALATDTDRADPLPTTLSVPGGWNDPTQFSTAVIPPWTVAHFPWPRAALLTLGTLLLLVVPARLLAGTLTRARGGRPVWRRRTFAGRNRASEEFDVAPTLSISRWAIFGGAVAIAAVFVLLSGPVSGTPAYLRLLLAVVLALLLVNAVATLVPQRWAARALSVPVTTTILPRYLVVVAITALGSRIVELNPALLFGLVGSVVLGGPAVAQRGQLAAVRAGSLLGLGLVTLLVVGILPAADGFASTLAAEFANTVVLASIGSAALVLVPVGNTGGRSILAWSPPIWAALTVPAFLILFTLLSPMLPRWTEGGTAVFLGVAAMGFAAVSVAAWAWQRYLMPLP